MSVQVDRHSHLSRSFHKKTLPSSSSSEPNPRDGEGLGMVRSPSSSREGRGGEGGRGRTRSFSGGGGGGRTGRMRGGEQEHHYLHHDSDDQRDERDLKSTFNLTGARRRQGIHIVLLGGLIVTLRSLGDRDRNLRNLHEGEDEENFPQRETTDRYPYCVVWTYLPFISTLIPCIGHVGICTAEGVVHDFAGPYAINVDHMAFHRPMKVWKLNPLRMHPPGDAASYDTAIEVADARFRATSHNLCCNNCHHHVARALSQMAYDGKKNWTQLDVWWNLAIRGRFLRWRDWLIVWGPWVAIAVLALMCAVLLPWLHYP